MRKILLSMALASISSLAMAQWNTDAGHGIKIWEPDFTNYGYTTMTNSSGTTFAFFHGVYGETQGDGTTKATYPMYVQVIDKDGNKLCDGDGMILSNEPNISWTKVNQDVALANDGGAFFSVSDRRNGDGGDVYSIYKVNAKGELEWGDKSLNGGEINGMTAAMTICPTTDGGAIFAYMRYGSDGVSFIQIEKLDKNGEAKWTEYVGGDVNVAYPYLVDAGDNQALLIYAEGSNQILKARLLDYDGSSAWGDEDVTIYRGGFSSNPLHTMLKVTTAKDGALISWHDPDNTTGSYENRISYINKDDGELLFADGDAGTIVSNMSYFSRMRPELYFDESENAVYAAFYVFLQTQQDIAGIYVQKISDEGELLWGADGIGVEPITVYDDGRIETSNMPSLAAPLIRTAGDGKTAVFYLKQLGGYSINGEVNPYMAVYDKNGKVVTESQNITPDDHATKNNLAVSDLIDGDHYVFTWEEVESIGSDATGEAVHAAVVYLDGRTSDIGTVDAATANSMLRQQVYGIGGEQKSSLQKGLNIVRQTSADGTTTARKVMVK